jgi:hypothetical protein
MKHLLAVLAILAVLTGVPPASVAAPDGTLAVALTPDRLVLWPSQTLDVALLLEYRNTTPEPLRIRPPAWPYEGGLLSRQERGRIMLRSSEGTHYIATGQEGTGSFAGPFSSNDFSLVLPPHAAIRDLWSLGTVCRTDANGSIEWDAEDRDPAYRGDLPPGLYDIWLQHVDGRIENSGTERSPGGGLYTSAPVRIRVVPEGAPLAASPRLLKPGARPQPVLATADGALVSARALEPWGVKVRVTRDAVVLSRGKVTATIPIARGAVNAATRKTTAVPALNSPSPFVPLRHAAERLRFRVAYEPRTKVYRLESLGKA